MDVQLDENERKSAFLMLVSLQDNGQTVRESRVEVANQYGISATDVFNIECEGIEKAWPPLRPAT